MPDEVRQQENDEAHELTVVGIGASAGGLAALKTFFSEVPADSGLAFVVVVHLSPQHESHLADLLQPSVRMPVQQVTETVRLEPDHVYVIPPGRNLSTTDAHLRLSPLQEKRIERAPIDHFLRTLARTHDGHAVGVILTGTGSDGTLGLREIKANGGLTVVQDPSEAEYDGMPQSAVAAGAADLVVPLDEMPERIVRSVRTRPRLALGDDAKVDRRQRRTLRKVLAQVHAVTGRDFTRYKRATITRRIQRRMQIRQVEELRDYLELLRSDGEEVRTLTNDFLITVTRFFRDPDVYAKLEADVVPRLLQGRGPDDTVRVWSVGCATGEEVYSLAMLLLEALERREDAGPRLQLFASDLHEASLVKAREGLYHGDIDADVSPERLRRFFQKEDGGFRIRKEVRELVVFAPHDLLGDPPFSKMDLVTCRNVMIYLQREVQQDVVRLFHYALRGDGHLLLGTSESLTGAELFKVESKAHSVYRRRNVPGPKPRVPLSAPARTRLGGASGRAGADPSAYSSLHQQMVQRFAPPSLLVTPDDNVAHSSDLAWRYLRHPSGGPTTNLFKLMRQELRIELRAAMHTARAGSPSSTKPTDLEIEGATRRVTLRVIPSGVPEHDGFLLVLFDEYEAPTPGPAEGEDDGSGGEVEALRGELELTRQRLQTVIEDYETSQEEMRASNEELQSANEELRSTMEELETSKEELQSMNEELHTVNQENRHKVQELAQLSNDLQNLLSATNIATLFLDRELRIMRFTPKMGDLLNVRTTDRGRPISDLTHHLGYDELTDDARQVLRTLVPIEREVEDDRNRWYLTRLLPYRSAEDRIEGVVITFVDITRRKASEAELRELAERLEERAAERSRAAVAHEERARRMANRLTLAEQKERRRISRLLHDELQQLLTAVAMRLQAVRTDLEERAEAALADELGEVSEWLARGNRMARELTSELSPNVLHSEGLAAALEWLRGPMRELHGLDLELQVQPGFEVGDEDLRAMLFQGVRELLFNVKKHAGVDAAQVRLGRSGPGQVIEVLDDGRGFDPSQLDDGATPDGVGLLDLRERIGLLGGRLEIESAPGAGTRVEIRFPAGSGPS